MFLEASPRREGRAGLGGHSRRCRGPLAPCTEGRGRLWPRRSRRTHRAHGRCASPWSERADGWVARWCGSLTRRAWEIVCAVSSTDVGRDVGELAGVGPLAPRDRGSCGRRTRAGRGGHRFLRARRDARAGARRGGCRQRAGVGDDRPARGRSRGTRLRGGACAGALGAEHESGRSRADRAGEPRGLGSPGLGRRDRGDAPPRQGGRTSGTALRLAETAQRAREAAGPTRLAHGREGNPGARPPGEIGMHALRGATWWAITSASAGRRRAPDLVHRATSRDVFAYGALRAARWIAGRPAGRYALRDLWPSARFRRSDGCFARTASPAQSRH